MGFITKQNKEGAREAIPETGIWVEKKARFSRDSGVASRGFSRGLAATGRCEAGVWVPHADRHNKECSNES